jgi:hypothetical protein
MLSMLLGDINFHYCKNFSSFFFILNFMMRYLLFSCHHDRQFKEEEILLYVNCFLKFSTGLCFK